MGSVYKKRGPSQRPGAFQEVFDETHLNDRFNRPAALFLRKQPAEFWDSPNDDAAADKARAADGGIPSLTPQEYVTSFLEQSRGTDSVKRFYDKGYKDIAGDQRWFAVGATSLQACPSWLRSTLSQGISIDLDIQNCGPTILSQHCAQLGIECPRLDAYVNNREDMLSEFSPFLSRDEAKSFMIRIGNGGSIRADEADETRGVDWLQPFIAEGFKIRRRISELAKYAHVKARFQPKDKNKGLLVPDTANIDAKVVSAILLPLENLALENFFSFFKNAGIIKNGQCVLIFDGMMVADSQSNREHLTEDFLFKASQYVEQQCGLMLKIRVKEFKNAYALPDDYATAPETFFVVDVGDDKKPAEILRHAAGDRLVKSGARFFFNRGGCIFSEGKDEAEDGIMCLSNEVAIVSSAGEGRTFQYSNSTARMKAAIPRVLCDETIRDDNFVTKMFDGNLGFLAFTNGVYSFEGKCLLTFAEAKEREIRFIHDTNRAYNDNVDPELKQEVLRRIFQGFMPDADQLQHYLNTLARALAGRIEDKRWNQVVGGRNSSKSVQTLLLSRAFGSFVQGSNADNLLVREGAGQDAAKAQSWIADFEMKRVIFTNEMPQQGKQKIDGEMVKRLCSGGDVMEVRKLYHHEKRMRTQASLVLFSNFTTEVSPDDAYLTMQGWTLNIEYHDQSEFDAKVTQGVDPPDYWRVKDPTINDLIRREDVLDAVTAIIFEAYTSKMQDAPQRVKDDTDSIKGPASISVEDRFAAIIIKGGDDDFLSYADIQNAMKEGGMAPQKHDKIDTLVKRAYNIFPQKPSMVNSVGRSVQVRGFKCVKVSYDFTNPNPRDDVD